MSGSAAVQHAASEPGEMWWSLSTPATSPSVGNAVNTGGVLSGMNPSLSKRATRPALFAAVARTQTRVPTTRSVARLRKTRVAFTDVWTESNTTADAPEPVTKSMVILATPVCGSRMSNTAPHDVRSVDQATSRSPPGVTTSRRKSVSGGDVSCTWPLLVRNTPAPAPFLATATM